MNIKVSIENVLHFYAINLLNNKLVITYCFHNKLINITYYENNHHESKRWKSLIECLWLYQLNF